MKVVIIEDEKAAAENLKFLLSEVDSSIIVDRVIDNITETIKYFSEENNIELAFLISIWPMVFHLMFLIK